VRLLLKINPEEAIYYAKRMGISTHIDPVPSLAMGTNVVHPIEIVSAYTTFPNKGIHIPYRMIHKIIDRYGRIHEDNTAVHKEEVLSAQTAYIIVNMMQSVLQPGGTGQRTRWMGFTRPAGGKTGTSDLYCDNWFIGYTPQITAGCWVGFDSKTSLGRGQDGARNGVPVWTEFMITAHDSLPFDDFEEPEGIVHMDVCIESGEIATDRCIEVRNEVFVEGTEPTTNCHLHPSAGLYIPSRTNRQEDKPDTSDERVHF
jgi:penicillin-binding protein 1A